MEKTHGVLMVLALMGVLAVWLPRKLQRQPAEHIFFLRAVSLLIIYFLALHMILAPYPRYSIPMRPVLYAMALYPFVLVAGISGIPGKLSNLFHSEAGRIDTA